MAESKPDPYELRILGVPDLRAPDGRRVASVLSQPSRLGLLAYLTLAPGPVARSTIVADFWPESDEPRARNALSQAVFYLRRSLGKDAVQSVEGDRIEVSPERVWCDARELLTAERPPDQVVEAASGELLSGWNADASQPLQEWLDRTRRQVRKREAELERDREEPSAPGSGPEGEWHAAEGATGTRADGGRRAADTSEPPYSDHEGRGPSALSPRDLRLRTTAALLISVVALALVAVVALPGRPSDAAPATSDPARLAVLLPRVNPPADGTGLSELTLNAELLVDLPTRTALDVVSLPTAASLQDLMIQRTRIGAPDSDMPDWLLDVGVVVSAGTAHVQWQLYRGQDRAVFGADSFDQPFTREDELVMDVPRAIAEKVTAAVAELVR